MSFHRLSPEEIVEKVAEDAEAVSAFYRLIRARLDGFPGEDALTELDKVIQHYDGLEVEVEEESVS